MQHVLDEFGVYLKSSTFSADVKPLLKEVCSRVFGAASGLVDMMTAHFPSSRDATAHKVSPAELDEALLSESRGPGIVLNSWSPLVVSCHHVPEILHEA